MNALQKAMTCWGKPKRIRMDNGSPWGTQTSLPSALSLWLVGLGIRPVYGRPRQSTDNAVVERDHGVLAQWVEVEHCTNFQDCQRRLEWAVVTQRERYRSPKGYSRAQAFPDLFTNPRTYTPQQDLQQWSSDRVATYLSNFIFHRKVEINGRITLFANGYFLGKRYIRQVIQVRFDPLTYEWIFTDEQSRFICRHATKELTYAQISQLQLAKRRRH